MLIILGAVVIGVLVGLALGGSVTTLSGARFRWWPLALIGLALQVLPLPASLHDAGSEWLPRTLLLASYLVLLLFVATNLRMLGFGLVGVGLVLNLVVIAVNDGMPVGDQALRVAYGTTYRTALADLAKHGGAKHHLAGSDDLLVPLSDVIPIGRPVRNIFSVGDFATMLGIAWVLAAATRGPAGKHSRGVVRRRRAGASAPASPPDPGSRPEASQEAAPNQRWGRAPVD